MPKIQESWEFIAHVPGNGLTHQFWGKAGSKRKRERERPGERERERERDRERKRERKRNK